MSKYINADELKKRLSDDDVQFLKLVVSNRKMQSLEELIDEMPSADVVEVVRCKDCKNSVCIGERYFCDIQYDEWGQPYVVKPDGYCDCGEKRDEE